MDGTNILLICCCLLCLIAGSIADAAMDKMQFHYDRSIFADFKDQDFWNPAISWANKWKYFPSSEYPKGVEKFWGSSRWFVAFTDGWHCTQFFQLWLYAAAAITALFIDLPLVVAIGVDFMTFLIVVRLVMSVTFSIFFDKLLVRREK